MLDDLIGKITCADCLDILKQLPDKCVDLVLTDPPYGIKMAKNFFIDTKRGREKGFVYENKFKKKDWDNQRPDKIIFDEIRRVSKNQIIFGGNYFSDMLPSSRGWIVWDKKENNRIAPNFADCELCWTSFDKNIKKYVFGWYGVEGINNRQESKIHPTQKPLELFGKILLDYTNENDIVLDCFSGSGTTAIACHNLHRRFICIEKDPEYAKASQERLEQAQRQQTLF
jgi:site-specific DNA-methyltransferase (adenine-specific)